MAKGARNTPEAQATKGSISGSACVSSMAKELMGWVGVEFHFTQKFCDHTQNREAKFLLLYFPLRNSVLQSCFWLIESKFFIFVFFLVFSLLFLRSWFIHFGATEKDLGFLGLWDCSPFPHRHTNVDSRIAVYSTNKHQQATVLDDSSVQVFQQTTFKFVHNSAHGT